MEPKMRNSSLKLAKSHILSKLHPVPRDLITTLMMDAASTFETSVNFHQSTRRNNPKDIRLETRSVRT
jgi:hypothetical protein